MNGRTEHKIKTENKTIEIINKSDFDLKGFYNYISSKYEHKTKELYITYIIKFLSQINKEYNDIESSDINEYINNLTYKNVDNEKVETSGTYRGVVHSALKIFFQYLYESNLINKNPMCAVPRPKPKKDALIERIYLKPNEIQVIINNIKNDNKNVLWKNRNLLIMMVFLYTGIRCTAVTEINIEDVNITDKTLVVIDKRNKKRVFKLDDDFIELYNDVVLQDKKININNNALFISNRHNRISSRTISRVIETYSEDLNKHITPHKLRRSYGQNLYNETKDIYVVKNALGHEDIRTTQLYVQGDNTEAAKKGMYAMKNKIKF